jgi:hypothetical protein
VWNDVEFSMLDRVGSSMENSLWMRVRECVRELVQKEARSGGWDMYDGARKSVSSSELAGFLAIYRFFHEVFEENSFIHLARFNELVSGYWLGRKEAWLVRKPVILKNDEQGRLHNASGPCVQYRDGWGWYAWHGVTVPEQIILHPEQVTREEWMQEHNLEVRRAIQERLGMERFIEMLGGICFERGRRGTLVKVWLGHDDPDGIAHYVQVQDSSTQRQYYLRVPPSITSADEAIAWTFGLNARDYQPGQET